jgi:hypothetical protein
VIETLLRNGATASPIYPCSDHLTLASAINPTVACLLLDHGAPVTRTAMVALINTRTPMLDDTHLLEKLIDGGIDPTTTNMMTSAHYASTIPHYSTSCRYAIGTIIMATAPPTGPADMEARERWPIDTVSDALHPAVVTDIAIAWNQTLCVRIHFLKFRGHYDEYVKCLFASTRVRLILCCVTLTIDG